MSYASESKLEEQWSDITATKKCAKSSTTATATKTQKVATKKIITTTTADKPPEHPAPPPASPTSPKATKFCCCPQRRRYHLKQSLPKKSTLHARNVFIDNDFNFIDDVGTATNIEDRSANGSCYNRYKSTYRKVPLEEQLDAEKVKNATAFDSDYECKENIFQEQSNNNDYDDIDNIVSDNINNKRCINNCSTGNCIAASLMNHNNNNRNAHESQWRHYKNMKGNNNANQLKNEQCNDFCTDDILTANNVDCIDAIEKIATTTTATITSTITTPRTVNQLQNQQEQQQIQRLSCNEFINKAHNLSNNHYNNNNNNSNNQCCCSNNYNTYCDNYCKQHERVQPSNSYKSVDENIVEAKMTIATTTNVANRKRGSECGLSPVTTVLATTTTTTTTTTVVSTATSSCSTSSKMSQEIATTSSHSPTTTTNTSTTTTTVIKTTMVKRSPSNESTTQSPTTTIPATAIAGDVVTTVRKEILNGDNKLTDNASNAVDSKGNGCFTEPTRTVRERIAALKASNEQNSNNNNNIQFKRKTSVNDGTQWNNIQLNQQMNMTTNSAESSAIKSLHHNNNNNNNSNKNSCRSTVNGNNTIISDSKATAAIATASTSTSINVAEKPENAAVARGDGDEKELHSTDCIEKSATANSVLRNHCITSTTGAATMPRRRCSSNNNNNSCSSNGSSHNNVNGSKYGSNSEAMSSNIDKNFLSQTLKSQSAAAGNVDVASSVDKNTSGCHNGSHRFSALDNLDLALNVDLTDEDGEDPYFVLQEYLERVKHEINEVFELHKARQRTQQQEPTTAKEEQEQQQIVHAAATTNDELSRSTESDSGFDSATGGRLGSNRRCNSSNNNKLQVNEETGQVTEITCQNEVNGYAELLPEKTGNTQKEQTYNPNNTDIVIKSRTAPVSSNSENMTNSSISSSSATLKRLREQFAAKSAANSDEVNIWANKFLRDLDNLMASTDKCTSSSAASTPTSTTSPMLLSAAASAAIQSRYGKHNATDRDHNTNGIMLRPEKHATIPLQSFKLDCKRQLDVRTNSNNYSSQQNSIEIVADCSVNGGGNTTKSHVAYMRTLSAPMPTTTSNNRQHLAATEHQQHNHNLTNVQSNNNNNNNSSSDGKTATTILKIEETAQTTSEQQKQQHQVNEQEILNRVTGEDVELINTSRQCQLLENDMETIRNSLMTHEQQQQQQQLQQQLQKAGGNNCGSSNKNMPVASGTATSIPKRERINHATTSTVTTKSQQPQQQQKIIVNNNGNIISPNNTLLLLASSKTNGGAAKLNGTTPSYLLNGIDVTKKGSTSTIWTSEESILRSVGAVDEDNNSTSSSACEEATGVLSSGKSGVSLDSSGLDNDNNESGIGTATPPKDMSYWQSGHHNHHHHANESLNSLDALRKIKLQKGISVVSSDDPDLLEVLSLCDEPLHTVQNSNHEVGVIEAEIEDEDLALEDGIEDVDIDADMDDEVHDEFQAAAFCDYGEFTDGDASSASGSSSIKRNALSRKALPKKPQTNCELNGSGVVLRRKYNALPVMVPQKCRSHSFDYPQHQLTHQQHSQLSRKLQHMQQTQRGKERAQLSLALRQEPFQSLLPPTQFQELPSPSTASLHSGHESLGMQELTTKSNSAPLLLKQEKRRDDFAGPKLALRYSRSQSDRYLAEIEAVEACKWLRAAGFPQYAQMYEDHQFPIDLNNVAKDHTNLENDQLQSLYRRLCILNRCANMRLDQSHKAQTPQKEDSDDENFALSEHWTFQRNIKRWSRVGESGLELPSAAKINADKTESSSKESSPDRFEDDSYDMSSTGLSLAMPSENTDANSQDAADSAAVRLRRTGSERLKDGAKAFLRRVESIKSRRRKRQNREGVVISGPQTLVLTHLNQRNSLRKPDAVYSTPPSPSALSPVHTFPKTIQFGNELTIPLQSENFLSPNRNSPKRTPTTPRSMRTSPLHFFTHPMPHLKEGKSDDSSSYYSDSQESSAGGVKMNMRKMPSKTKRFLQRSGKVDDIGTHSDSECHQGRKLLIKDANSNNTEVKVKKLQRGGSLNLGKDVKKREGFRTASFRSRSTNRKDTKTEEMEHSKKSPPVRWHSFQMEERPHMIFRKCFTQKFDQQSDNGMPFHAMSAGQLQILRKLALVILTGNMERYCPTHRSGWNWELPKFIKKIKMPDYKDKRVFGVPLLLILQRTGQTLPIAVRTAFRWLQLNALDQIGLFRKSGVKSRILKLKELIEYSENATECMDTFDTQQAYDVADMVKQFFRDLPESLLTTKMSETFVAIFQHLPPDVRLDAVQCAVLLLPDENREILYALLEFLTLVAANSQYNQMTANNLAVCLAPSLFHTCISTGSATVQASPRRRGKGSGVPDVKELSEAKASHECLAFMIENYKQIFTASKEKISKCNFGYMEESKPVPLEALGEGMQFHNWRGYLYECTTATIKEGREKTRGWFSINSIADAQVEIAYKKVGDGHPLRLWRCITEVEGPPKETLEYIIKQRAHWDPNLLQSQTVKKLDDRTEIFQYTLDGQFSTDFCVLRAWQTDLPRGACVIVETSIDHANAKPMYGAVRGVVLASRYLIEPCGSGRSRVMHLSRVDIKGKTPEWYNKSYGHICSHFLSRIRTAFKNVAEGPESKV